MNKSNLSQSKHNNSTQKSAKSKREMDKVKSDSSGSSDYNFKDEEAAGINDLSMEFDVGNRLSKAQGSSASMSGVFQMKNNRKEGQDRVVSGNSKEEKSDRIESISVHRNSVAAKGKAGEFSKGKSSDPGRGNSGDLGKGKAGDQDRLSKSNFNL